MIREWQHLISDVLPGLVALACDQHHIAWSHQRDTLADGSFAIGDLDKDGLPDSAVARSDAPNVVYFGSRRTRKVNEAVRLFKIPLSPTTVSR